MLVSFVYLDPYGIPSYVVLSRLLFLLCVGAFPNPRPSQTLIPQPPNPKPFPKCSKVPMQNSGLRETSQRPHEGSLRSHMSSILFVVPWFQEPAVPEADFADRLKSVKNIKSNNDRNINNCNQKHHHNNTIVPNTD